MGENCYYAVNSDKTWEIWNWEDLSKPVCINANEWPRVGEMGANPIREGNFKIVTKLHDEYLAG